jgi:nicotinate-nucleotide pyrophosphorylase (carboxylating)
LYTEILEIGDGQSDYTCPNYHEPHRMSNQYPHLLPPSWKPQVTAWLAEDIPSFDYGGFIVGEAEREAFLFGKGSRLAVLAGSPFFTEVFEQLGCS